MVARAFEHDPPRLFKPSKNGRMATSSPLSISLICKPMSISRVYKALDLADLMSVMVAEQINVARISLKKPLAIKLAVQGLNLK